MNNYKFIQNNRKDKNNIKLWNIKNGGGGQ